MNSLYRRFKLFTRRNGRRTDQNRPLFESLENRLLLSGDGLQDQSDDESSPYPQEPGTDIVLPSEFTAAAEATPLAISTSTTLPSAVIGEDYNLSLQALGGSSPYTWSLVKETADNYIETVSTMPSEDLGTAMGWKGDDVSFRLTLPWTFNFYGVDYTEVYVSTNGYIDFSSTSQSDFSNSDGELINNVRIAPLWDDLRTDRSGDIYVDSSQADCIHIRWRGTTYLSTAPVDFSAILYRNGDIRFDYHITHEGLTPTIGISGGNGDAYVFSQHNRAVHISSDMSLFFQRPVLRTLPPGLTLDPQAGAIYGIPTQEGSFDFTIQLDDVNHDTVRHDFHLDVLPGSPEIDILNNSLAIDDGSDVPSIANGTDFGELDIAGGSLTQIFTIQNTGTAALLVQSVNISGDEDFSVTEIPSGSVPAGGQTTFAVTFNPNTPGQKTATVIINSNDSDEDSYDFQIQGSAFVVGVPEIDVIGNGRTILNGDNDSHGDDGTEFGEVDANGIGRTHIFTIENPGTGDLTLQTVEIGGSSDFTVTQTPASVVPAGGNTILGITFAPTEGGNQTATVRITSDSATDGSYRFQITGRALPLTVVTTATLPEATVGVEYDYTLVANGGFGPYTWSSNGPSNESYIETVPGPDSPDLGSAMRWQADDASYELTLPWSFQFYGVDYTKIHVSTNGFIDFVSPHSDYANSTAKLADNIRIAPLWDDLRMDRGGDIYVETNDPNSAQIRWQGTTYYDAISVDFSVTLFRNGNIRFDYHIPHHGLTPTIGISSGDGTHYTLSQLNNTAVLSQGEARQYVAPRNEVSVNGLVLDPLTGRLRGTPTEAGVTTFAVIVSDSGNPATQVIRSMTLETVEAYPEISIRQDSHLLSHGSIVDLGDIDVHAGSVSKNFTITNQGTDVLHIDAISISGNGFALSQSHKTSLIPGESTSFEMNIDPDSTGTKTASVEILSDDSERSPFRFEISINGVDDHTEVSTYYVSPQGNDHDSGTLDAPWRTISYAMSENSPVGPGDTVFVNPGVYRESVTIEKNGTPEAPITLKGLGPEGSVILDGTTVLVDGWSGPDARGIYSLPYSDTNSDNNLYQDGRKLALAMQPDAFDVNDPFKRDHWYSVTSADVVIPDSAEETDMINEGVEYLTLSEDFRTVDGMPVPDDYWNGAILYHYNWALNVTYQRPVLNYDADTNRVTLDLIADDNYHRIMAPNDQYALGNHPGLISQPGEYSYFDGNLLFRPFEDVLTNVEIPSLESGLVVSGSHVAIDNMTVTRFKEHGILIRNSDTISLENLVVQDNGNNGITGYSSQNIRIINNELTLNANNGINFGSRTSQIEILDSDIHHNGNNGIWLGSGTPDLYASEDILIKNTRIAFQGTARSHPDNIQLHQVNNLVIEDSWIQQDGHQNMWFSYVGKVTIRNSVFIGGTIGFNSVRELDLYNNLIRDCQIRFDAYQDDVTVAYTSPVFLDKENVLNRGWDSISQDIRENTSGLSHDLVWSEAPEIVSYVRMLSEGSEISEEMKDQIITHINGVIGDLDFISNNLYLLDYLDPTGSAKIIFDAMVARGVIDAQGNLGDQYSDSLEHQIIGLNRVILDELVLNEGISKSVHNYRNHDINMNNNAFIECYITAPRAHLGLDEYFDINYNYFNIENAFYHLTWDSFRGFGTESILSRDAWDLYGQYVDPEQHNYYLALDSRLRDAGTDVGLPYNGDASDIGPFESTM